MDCNVVSEGVDMPTCKVRLHKVVPPLIMSAGPRLIMDQAVIGSDSVGKCSRLSQPSCLLEVLTYLQLTGDFSHKASDWLLLLFTWAQLASQFAPIPNGLCQVIQLGDRGTWV